MLTAERDGLRIEAAHAGRGDACVCPACGVDLVLKRGRRVVAHFAHRAPIVCRAAAGETLAHLEAKEAFRAAFAARGLRAEVEWRLVGDPAERRSDLAVWAPSGRILAIELQHSAIGRDEVERRTRSYLAAGIRPLWVPLLPAGAAAALAAKDVARGLDDPGLLFERFAMPDWLGWVARLAGGRLAFWDAERRGVWIGRARRARLFRPAVRLTAADGRTRDLRAGWRDAGRLCDLRLWGPLPLDQIRVVPAVRRVATPGLPAGPVAWLDGPDGLAARLEAFLARLAAAARAPTAAGAAGDPAGRLRGAPVDATEGATRPATEPPCSPSSSAF